MGSRVEIDIATFADQKEESSQGNGGIVLAKTKARVWTPPAPEMRMPAIFPDSIEVLVINPEAGPTVVAAVELISPGNKDRDESRRGFAAKCATYLQQGIGLVMIDIVTERNANLHNELIALLGTGSQFLMTETSLYGVAYRPVRRPKSEWIEIWTSVLTVGKALPVLPLALDKRLGVPLDLQASYEETCQRSRLS